MCPAKAEMTVQIKECTSINTCLTSGGEKLRLACIKPIEQNGTTVEDSNSNVAKMFLNKMIAGNVLQIERISLDSLGRTIAKLKYNGIDIQKLALSIGIAQKDTRNLRSCALL